MHPLMSEDFNEDDLLSGSNDIELGTISTSPIKVVSDLVLLENLVDIPPSGHR